LQSYKIDSAIVKKLLIVSPSIIVVAIVHGRLSGRPKALFKKKRDRNGCWSAPRGATWCTLVQHTHLCYIRDIVIYFSRTENIRTRFPRDKPNDWERPFPGSSVSKTDETTPTPCSRSHKQHLLTLAA
jgi:hypothetical protein